MKIAIDGPAGAGKSTIAKKLAGELGFVYLDTGAMYRAVALKMLNLQIEPTDSKRVEETLEKTAIEIRYENGVQKVFLDGWDVSEKIREHAVSKAASDFSALPCVRIKMVELQRELAEKRNTILDGRDIGTFVLPNAEIKFFLTASVDERAKRRHAELSAKGINCLFEEIKRDIEQRDYNDSHREFAPLKKADDAITVDTTSMSIEQVAAHMLAIVRKKEA